MILPNSSIVPLEREVKMAFVGAKRVSEEEC